MRLRRGKPVNYNTGHGVALAFIVAVHEDTKIDLVFFDPDTNAVDGAQDVPRRDPSDYGPEGGGRTWHPIA